MKRFAQGTGNGERGTAQAFFGSDADASQVVNGPTLLGSFLIPVPRSLFSASAGGHA